MLAHLVQTGFGGFYDGLAHWASSPRDVLVVVALALLAGLTEERRARVLVLSLPTAWFVAGLVGLRLPPTADLTLATIGTVGTVATLVALERLPAPSVCTLLACACGVVHGLDNGLALAGAERPLLDLAGATTAVSLALLLLTAAALRLPQAPAWRIALRVGGSWLTATAILMLAWQLR